MRRSMTGARGEEEEVGNSSHTYIKQLGPGQEARASNLWPAFEKKRQQWWLEN